MVTVERVLKQASDSPVVNLAPSTLMREPGRTTYLGTYLGTYPLTILEHHGPLSGLILAQHHLAPCHLDSAELTR